ncbi:hypothetical protein VTP01DRAFT_4243 [Rhizomucor pusillus]|uniref:uncharacterized protein n=1 Tax=Rhizomucor pusillus TaxID=4840 RepID=UPI0037443108
MMETTPRTVDRQNDLGQITILRIKRKRNEEPLDALLLQDQSNAPDEKRLRKEGGNLSTSNLKISATAFPTIFRLAETVEENSFKNLAEAEKLRERIARRAQPLSRPRTPETTEERKDKLMQDTMNKVRQARYRVINQNRARTLDDNTPPVVQSSSEKAAQDLFQMYEAVREDEHQKQPKLFPDEDLAEDDDIMCNFIPMVKEYLTLNEKTAEESEDDYVYDVYYRDDSNHNLGISSANIGSLVWFDEETQFMNDDSESEPGDYGDEDSNAEDYYQNDYPDEESDEEFEDQYNYELSSDDEDYAYY